jgi:predicted nucleic acid-binding protein
LSEFICNTSPFQYLHQIRQLHLLPALTGGVVVPDAVAEELEAGFSAGCDVPVIRDLSWVKVRQPASSPVLCLARGLGRGEAAVLALALEAHDSVVILDDRLARHTARLLGLRFTGTLGLLLDAKRKGLVRCVGSMLDELDGLGFRLSAGTRAAVLMLAGELTDSDQKPST